jgi:hypothetical protein
MFKPSLDNWIVESISNEKFDMYMYMVNFFVWLIILPSWGVKYFDIYLYFLYGNLLHILRSCSACVSHSSGTRAHVQTLRRSSCDQQGSVQSRILTKSELVSIIYVYVQGRPPEIKTPAHRNMIGNRTTTPPLVSSSNSILPPPPSHCAFIRARKNWACY